ncbi:MAG: efflux RND transporter permease subunit, partial [Acidobacteriota bacterium]
MSERIAEFLYRWRTPLSLLIVIGAIACIPTATIVTNIDNDITAWFSRKDPVYQQYERFRQEFGGTRSLIVALQTQPGQSIFTDGTFKYLEDVTADIERVQAVQRVQSLSNANIVSSESGPDATLLVRPLSDIFHEQGIADVRRLAMSDDLLRGDLVSGDARVAAIIVTFDEDRVDAVRSEVIDAIHSAVLAKLPPGITPHFNGSLEISETYNRVTLSNTFKFAPPILILTLGAIYLMFRSWRRTLLAMVAVLISVFWTLGLYTLMGFTYNVLASMLVPLIIVLAIADDVHIMQHYEHERRHRDPEHAFKATVSHLLAPLLGASATTALGMLSLATSDVVAVREFGIGSCVGIMTDFLISIVFMPTCLTLLKPELEHVAPHEKHLLEPMRRVARFSSAHPKSVITVASIISVVTIA